MKAAINMDAVKATDASQQIDKERSIDLTAGVGSALRLMRQIKGMRQADVAEKVGLERTSVANIEAGRQKLSVLALCQFADALGVEVQIAFKDKGGDK